MNIQDKAEFSKLMTVASAVYDKSITTEMLKIYFDLLIDYKVEQIATAFKAHMMDPEYGSFFPKPADIIRQIDKKNNIDGANFRPFLQNKTENSPPPEGFFEEIRKML